MPGRVTRKTRAAVPDGPVDRLLPIVGWAGGAFLGAVLVFGGVRQGARPAGVRQADRDRGPGLPAAGRRSDGDRAGARDGPRQRADPGASPERGCSAPSALLVAFFLFLTGRSYYRDPARHRDGGRSRLRVLRQPGRADAGGSVLAGPGAHGAGAGAGLPRPARGRTACPFIRLAVVGALTVGLLAFARAAPDLPLDNVATRLKPDLAIDGICSGDGRQPALPEHDRAGAGGGRALAWSSPTWTRTSARPSTA